MFSQVDIEALIGRLQDHALAEPPGTMADEQVDAAITLLSKAMPDLVEIELNSAEGMGAATLVKE